MYAFGFSGVAGRRRCSDARPSVEKCFRPAGRTTAAKACGAPEPETTLEATEFTKFQARFAPTQMRLKRSGPRTHCCAALIPCVQVLRRAARKQVSLQVSGTARAGGGSHRMRCARSFGPGCAMRRGCCSRPAGPSAPAAQRTPPSGPQPGADGAEPGEVHGLTRPGLSLFGQTAHRKRLPLAAADGRAQGSLTAPHFVARPCGTS